MYSRRVSRQSRGTTPPSPAESTYSSRASTDSRSSLGSVAPRPTTSVTLRPPPPSALPYPYFQQPAVKPTATTVVSTELEGDDLESIALDVDMMSILQNGNLKGDLRWYQYYRTLERHIYKRDPTFKPVQFTVEVQEKRRTRRCL